MDGTGGLKSDESCVLWDNNTEYDGGHDEDLVDPCASMLYISTLGYRISANEIMQYIATHNLGRVVSIKVGQVHGVSQYCLCSLESPKQAKRAVEVLHGLSALGSSGLFVKHVGKELRAIEKEVCMVGEGNPGMDGMLGNQSADAQDDLETQDSTVINDCDGIVSVSEAVEKFHLEEKTKSSSPAAGTNTDTTDDENADGNEDLNGGFTTLYLINLEMEITEEDLYNDFSAYGTVVATKVLRKDGAFHKAMSGFIEFSRHVEAKRTKEILNGNAYRGSLVYPRWATRSLQKCLRKQQRDGGKIWSTADCKHFGLSEKKDTLHEKNPFNVYNKNGERRIEVFAARKAELPINESPHGWRIPSSYSMPGTYVPSAVESMHLHQQPPVYMQGYSQTNEYQHRMGYPPVRPMNGLLYGPGYCMMNPSAYPPYNEVMMGYEGWQYQYGYTDGTYSNRQTRRNHRNKRRNGPRRQQE
jgi:RNA recognition motif-containing protein/uncharacterized protein YoaH (UPF0181 family)